MPLTLTVEDGSIVSGANSYASLDQIKAYSAQRNIALPTTGDDAIIALAMQAMDYLEAYEPRWKGDRAVPLLQDLSWPRVNVYLFGQCSSAGMWPVNGIPSKLIAAQCYLTSVADTVDLYAVQDTRAITKEVIGPLQTEYDPKTGATYQPIVPQLTALLAQLVNSGGGVLTAVRV